MNHFSGGGCNLGEVHAGPCVFESVRQISNKPVVLDRDSNKRVLELERQVAALQAEIAALAKPFDKTAYQREYMRKRRLDQLTK